MRTIGVDVGGTSVRAGLVDEHGQVLDTARGLTPPEETALEDVIASVVRSLAERHPVDAVGLAVAGFITADQRGVMFAPHLPWRAAPVADRVAERLGLPVLLEHDANAAAVGEHRFGALAGASVGLMVALGTGIGGALLIDGRVFRGAHGVAPELGHLRLVPNGRPCGCGKEGCWERYCSGTALAATAASLRPADAPPLTGRKVAAAARTGDPAAVRAMADLAHWLGEGLAIAADVYDPEVIAIGGGVSESAELFLDDARDHYAKTVTGSGHRPLARVRPAQLGDNAGMIGAAVLAAEKLG
ncbi:ROK family protein [Actinokineospora guangxiensis]|uniref:ROK family protein n=1 Tax=Actinokineospora guangxiensis TaxID=1490288 RepID=A0ABW0EJV5_9PSEU